MIRPHNKEAVLAAERDWRRMSSTSIIKRSNPDPCKRVGTRRPVARCPLAWIGQWARSGSKTDLFFAYVFHPIPARYAKPKSNFGEASHWLKTLTLSLTLTLIYPHPNPPLLVEGSFGLRGVFWSKGGGVFWSKEGGLLVQGGGSFGPRRVSLISRYS